MIRLVTEIESREPLLNVDFSSSLINWNRLIVYGFDRWAFYQGMVFGSKEKWWGDWGKRVRAHEGLDLCFYTNKHDKIIKLELTTQIITMLAGTVAEVVDDLLGKSVFIKHNLKNSGGNHLFTIYSHINPVTVIDPGVFIDKAEVISTIADTKKKNPELPPHLHISIVWIPASLEKKGLNWKNLNNSDSVIFLDPLRLINCDYTILKSPEVF